MQKYKAKKEVVEQITGKLQANKIEKSNSNHDALGRFTFGKFAPDTGANSGGSDKSFNLNQKLNKDKKQEYSDQIHLELVRLYNSKNINEINNSIIFHSKVVKSERDNNFSNGMIRILSKMKKVFENTDLPTKSFEIENKNIAIAFENSIEKAKENLTEKYKNNVQNDIKNGNWVEEKTENGNSFYVDVTKYYDMSEESLNWEKLQAGLYADLGMKVYLLKEDNNSIDSIINDMRFEFKYVHGEGKKTFGNATVNAIKQSDNISFFIAEESIENLDSAFRIINGKQNVSSRKLRLACAYSQKEKLLRFKNYDIKKSGLLKSSPVEERITFLPSSYIIPNLNNKSSKINKSLTYSGYKLQGRTKLYDMDISIENKKGSYRSGVDSDGHKWRTYMNYDYGYIRGTVGVDKDHLDCVSPDTKILMSDYTEKCASDIKIGDELIGIKIETQRYHQRKQIITKVLNVKKGVDDMLDITLSNGVKLRTTKGHLHYYFQGNTRDKYWKCADELKIGDKLVMIFNHQDLLESDDYKKGYLFGAYTGDGCVSFDETKQVYCDIRKGVAFIDVLHRVRKYWNDLGLETSEIRVTKPRQTNSVLHDGRKIISKMDLAELTIRGNNKIHFVKSILVKNPNSYEWCRGYLAGIYDTDGCLNRRHDLQISQTKNQDEFMKFTIFCMGKLGYKAVQRNNELRINTDYMADNVIMEFTQLIKPSIEKKRNFLGQSYRFEPLEIIDIKPYKGEFIAIQTDEQTYIANGLVTHNCYIGPDKKADKVYVIHQNNPVTHKYDEDKCMLCFESADAAKKAYMKQYDRPGFFGSMETLTIEQFKSFVFSKKGKRIHKSFDVCITDITDNNKNQKIEQLQKSLNALYLNKPFVIKHIEADTDSHKYEPITMRISNFDKNKIEKAVHKMAMTLDAEIKSTNFGEAFNFKCQEELTDELIKEITQKTNSVYQFVIDYFDLPEIRIVSKSVLRHKGKIIYDPETGKPIEKSTWDKFVKALEDFLNRNYKGIGEKIVLKGHTLGRILSRLAKTNSLEALKKKPLSEMTYKHRTFDWISENTKNMKDVFGDTISRETASRVEVACHSAAIKVTKVTDNMRNDIQDIIIDGVKNKESRSKISQKLFDKCVGLNRDFQRIADTEIQNNTNMAYLKEEVYNTEENEKVYFKRFEILDDNTCKQCRKIKGKIALWSDVALPDERIKDEYADYAIWEGKESGDMPVSVKHPYCYSDDTEVMTNNGWKLFKDVLDDDLIMSINPETYEIDFVPFINRIQYQYNGEMIHFPGRNFDMLVTPNHNMLIEERNSRKWHGVKADDLIDKSIYQIPRARGLWNGSNPEKIKIGCVEYSYIQYIKLWAWYLSEGSGRKKSDMAYEIKLAQKNIKKILDDIPEFSERFIKGKEALYCTGKIAEKFEQMFGVYAAYKYIPDFIKNSSAECIRAFLFSFNLGDGSKRNRENIENNSLGIKKANDFVVRTSSKKMADDLCELIIKAGWMPSIHVIKQKGKEVTFRNGTYKLNTDCYVINICKSKNKVYSKHNQPGHPKSHLPYKLNYNGMVYDVELEKWHFLLVKRNGKCGWSGNCRGSWFRYYPDIK